MAASADRMSISEITGSVGVAILLGAFFLNLIGMIGTESRAYQVLNAIGAGDRMLRVVDDWIRAVRGARGDLVRGRTDRARAAAAFVTIARGKSAAAAHRRHRFVNQIAGPRDYVSYDSTQSFG
jgi:hypothetical protein